MRFAIDHPWFARALTLADFVPVRIEFEVGGVAMDTCEYVDPAGMRCQKDAKFEILEASNELFCLACKDHEETIRIAAPGRQAHPHPIGGFSVGGPPPTTKPAPPPPPAEPLDDDAVE